MSLYFPYSKTYSLTHTHKDTYVHGALKSVSFPRALNILTHTQNDEYSSKRQKLAQQTENVQTLDLHLNVSLLNFPELLVLFALPIYLSINLQRKWHLNENGKPMTNKKHPFQQNTIFTIIKWMCLRVLACVLCVYDDE